MTDGIESVVLLTPLTATIVGGLAYSLLLLALVAARWSGTLTTRFVIRLGVIAGTTILAATVALSHPVWRQGPGASKPVLLVDISASVSETPAEEALTSARRLLSATSPEFAFARFIGRNVKVQGSFREIRDANRHLDLESTDLRRALLGLAHGSTVVLVTDGWVTEGSESAAISAAKERDLQIHVVPVKQEVKDDTSLSVSQLDLPLTAAASTEIVARVSVRNRSSNSQSRKLTLLVDQRELVSETLTLGPDQEVTVSHPLPNLAPGHYNITARIDGSSPNSTSHAVTQHLTVTPGEAVLLIRGGEEDAELLRRVAEQQRLPLIELDAQRQTLSEKALAQAAAVVATNVKGSFFSKETVSKLNDFVSSGGSLTVIGGPQAFGLGGYHDSPLDEILPVKSLPPQTVAKRVTAAVILVIDKSRSMADGDKLESAKEAAREVLRTLKDDDYVGVIGFDATPFIVARLNQLASSREQAIERVSRLFPAGKTILLPALDEARRALDRVEAGRKHIIVLTDGRLSDAGPHYTETVQELRRRGVTTSTVLVGDYVTDRFLQSLAFVGGGSFYSAPDPATLPRIFLSDIRVNTGERTMREASEYAVEAGPEVGRTLPSQLPPPVLGYVRTVAKPGSSVELVARDGDRADPLVASATLGGGTVVAITTDSGARWTANWSGWRGVVPFWHSAMSPSQKSDKSPPFDLRLDYNGEEGTVEVLIYGKLPGPAPTLRLAPTGTNEQNAQSLSLTAAAPGRYTAKFGRVAAPHYVAQLFHPNATFPSVTIAAPQDKSSEYARRGTNMRFLSELAASTGGTISPSSLPTRTASAKTAEDTDLRPPLLLLATVLAVATILTREKGVRAVGNNVLRPTHHNQRL